MAREAAYPTADKLLVVRRRTKCRGTQKPRTPAKRRAQVLGSGTGAAAVTLNWVKVEVVKPLLHPASQP
jgi:hypothetical protein